jgi:hypothetical protein
MLTYAYGPGTLNSFAHIYDYERRTHSTLCTTPFCIPIQLACLGDVPTMSPSLNLEFAEDYLRMANMCGTECRSPNPISCGTSFPIPMFALVMQKFNHHLSA